VCHYASDKRCAEYAPEALGGPTGGAYRWGSGRDKRKGQEIQGERGRERGRQRQGTKRKGKEEGREEGKEGEKGKERRDVGRGGEWKFFSRNLASR